MVKGSQLHSRRNNSLDVLRGIAILAVLVVHAPWPQWILENATGRVIRMGAYGVDLFFVLSGFLISRLLFSELQKTGDIRVTRFWIRRSFKIWPSYFAAYLAAGVVAVSWGNPDQFPLSKWFAWPNFVFLQNYIGYENRWFASWSLAVEEHFYTTLPLLLLLIIKAKKSMRTLAFLLIAICLLVPVMRFSTDNPTLIWIQTHLRMDALCIGVLLGYCENRKLSWPFEFLSTHPKLSFLITLAAIAIAVYQPYSHPFTHTIGFSVFAICFAIWTGDAVKNPAWGESGSPFISTLSKAVSGIGVCSYTIYLTQQLTLTLIDISKRLPLTSSVMNSHIPQVVVFIAGSIALGWLFAVLVERPGLALRERLVPKNPAV